MSNLINANTKISTLLRQHPDALEAIISISPKFNKLRNPILRKIMASRATISMASQIAGCPVDEFYRKLEPLGFTIDKTTPVEVEKSGSPIPGFMLHLSENDIIELDVRPIIEGGKDPFNVIMEKIDDVKQNHALKLINSFEPIPLMQILSKQGFEVHSESQDENTVITWFFRKDKQETSAPAKTDSTSDWDSVMNRFTGNLITVDVRALEMPGPMMTILEALDNLPDDKALFVYHKRVPVFLLPELNDRKFEYRIKEISDSEVHMIIYKN